MTCPIQARKFVVSLVALMKDVSLTKIGSRIGLEGKKVSHHLTKDHDLDDAVFEMLLQGAQATSHEVAAALACYEAVMEPHPELTPEERGIIEEAVLEVSQCYRELLIRAVPLSRAKPPLDGYPGAGDLEPARWLAGLQLDSLRELPAADRLPVVKAARELQTWALCERVAEESVQAASRDLGEAFHWARLARQIALRVRGPEDWRRLIRGYSAAFLANILRVAGRLKRADRVMEEARRLWSAGSDPGQVLDPGRLLDLQASLRRDQRRFPEAVSLLNRAFLLSRSRARILIKKGFTLEVMGDYEGAIKALLEAEPLLDRSSEPRLWYDQRFNLAVVLTHLGRYTEATELAEQAREVVINLGDEIFLQRVTWLRGRIAAGLGCAEEARQLLEQARREFAARRMWYDVALAWTEHAALLLDEGRTAEVKRLTLDLALVFDSEDVHQEVLKALHLFREAAEREAATAEVARRLLRYLFQARHDQGLRFTS
ncbi:MAG TPA: tetratricopeptide repeat protein [Thermoanaerobaculia bacterium]|nr:tetratricopeptide repeat protein [Thermoanaerobaculia bacterium]